MSRLRLGLLFAALLTGLTLLYLSGNSAAQTKDTPAPKGYLPANWKKLGLSDDQVKMVYKIQAAYDLKEQALKQQLADLKKDEKNELEKVLTPAQKERLKEILLGTLDKDSTKDKAPIKDGPKDDAKDTKSK